MWLRVCGPALKLTVALALESHFYDVGHVYLTFPNDLVRDIWIYGRLLLMMVSRSLPFCMYLCVYCWFNFALEFDKRTIYCKSFPPKFSHFLISAHSFALSLYRSVSFDWISFTRHIYLLFDYPLNFGAIHFFPICFCFVSFWLLFIRSIYDFILFIVGIHIIWYLAFCSDDFWFIYFFFFLLFHFFSSSHFHVPPGWTWNYYVLSFVSNKFNLLQITILSI